MRINRIYKMLESLPYMAEVKFLSGSKVVAVNYNSEIIQSSENFAEVLTNAVKYVNSVGGGKVYIKGDSRQYLVSEQVDIIGVKNVVIEAGQGASLKLVNGATFNAINVENSSNVMIKGLRIDGNKDNVNYSTAPIYEALNCIRLRNSSNVIVSNNVLTNPYYFGVRLSDGNKNILIKDNKVYGFRDQGISAYNSENIDITDNVVYNGNEAGYVGGYIGIDVWLSKAVTVHGNIVYDVGPADGFGSGIRCEGSENVTISNNVLTGNAVDGVSAMKWTTSVPTSITISNNVCVANQMGIHVENAEDISIKGNISNSNTDKGIYVKDTNVLLIEGNVVNNNAHQNIMIDTCTKCKVAGNYAAYSGGNEGIIVLSGTDVDVVNNIVEYNPSNGIDLRNSTRCMVALNLSKNNNWNGIYLEDCQYVEVTFNRCYDDRATKNQDWGVQEYGTSDYNTIIYNDLRDNEYGAVTIVGANTVVAHNIGYMTENSGVATITSGSTSVTVTHGLVSAPSKVLITPLAQPAGLVWVANITSTTFDIVTDTAPTTDLPVTWQAKV